MTSPLMGDPKSPKIGQDLDLILYRQTIIIILWTLYSKVKEVNTATRNIKKIYYRVDKKTTS